MTEDRKSKARLFAGRANRLLFFMSKIEAGMQLDFPTSAEIDLVRKSLDEIEQAYVNDPEGVRKQRLDIDAEIKKEIEEAGGEEQWHQKMMLEFDEPEGSA
jgi:hypothetical protein